LLHLSDYRGSRYILVVHSFPTRRSSDLEFSKDIQIFLTTHSPAFYSLHGNPAAADSHLFHVKQHEIGISIIRPADKVAIDEELGDRKSTRLNSSHVKTSYAVFCLKKKKQ